MVDPQALSQRLFATPSFYLTAHQQTQGCHASRSQLFAFTWKICISEESCFPSQNILKRTKEGTKEEQMASKALALVSKVKAALPSPSALPTHVPLGS